LAKREILGRLTEKTVNQSDTETNRGTERIKCRHREAWRESERDKETETDSETDREPIYRCQRNHQRTKMINIGTQKTLIKIKNIFTAEAHA